jgi:hypothetical protein
MEQDCGTVAVIEILSFRLVSGASEEAFLAADKRVQTEFAYRQPGLLRRTTARAENSDWVVIDLWRSSSDADACDAKWGEDEATRDFMTFVDRSTMSVGRYQVLDAWD